MKGLKIYIGKINFGMLCMEADIVTESIHEITTIRNHDVLPIMVNFV